MNPTNRYEWEIFAQPHVANIEIARVVEGHKAIAADSSQENSLVVEQAQEFSSSSSSLVFMQVL